MYFPCLLSCLILGLIQTLQNAPHHQSCMSWAAGLHKALLDSQPVPMMRLHRLTPLVSTPLCLILNLLLAVIKAGWERKMVILCSTIIQDGCQNLLWRGKHTTLSVLVKWLMHMILGLSIFQWSLMQAMKVFDLLHFTHISLFWATTDLPLDLRVTKLYKTETGKPKSVYRSTFFTSLQFHLADII